MRLLFILLFTFISFQAYSSPYANPWLYKNMLDYINNPSKYGNDFKNGILEEDNKSIIIGTFIEKAYNVYEREEEYISSLIHCGDNCYQDNSTDILQTYNKFFYIYASVLSVSEILIKNPIKNENISYYVKNKLVSYTWKNESHLIISIDKYMIEFKKDKNNIKITTTMDIFKNYILN